mmetsp:Transcript_58989/g.125336  ORF Transcript_58989/g.125336 Transcript_58989/m.125336 type:complete len:391 (-) Transcript_58989:28-1200(-)
MRFDIRPKKSGQFSQGMISTSRCSSWPRQIMRILQVALVVLQRHPRHAAPRNVHDTQQLARQHLSLLSMVQHVPLVVRKVDGIVVVIPRSVVEFSHQEVNIVAQHAGGEEVGEHSELESLDVELHHHPRFHDSFGIRHCGQQSILYLVSNPGSEADYYDGPCGGVTPVEILRRHSAESRLPLLLLERRMIKSEIAVGVGRPRPRDYGSIPPPHIFIIISPVQFQMTFLKFWIGLEGEDAVVAIVPRVTELAREGRDRALGNGIEVRLVEEAGVYTDVGPHIEDDVVTSVAELGTTPSRRRRLTIGAGATMRFRILPETTTCAPGGIVLLSRTRRAGTLLLASTRIRQDQFASWLRVQACYRHRVPYDVIVCHRVVIALSTHIHHDHGRTS